MGAGVEWPKYWTKERGAMISKRVGSLWTAQNRTSYAEILTLAAILVTILAFGDTLLELVHRWSHQEEYSHAFLIPVVTAWLLWTRREALNASRGQPSWTGPGLVLVALAIHITGELSAIFILSQIAFVVALIGIVLAVGGYSLSK